jgi:hypothetical protein
MHRTSFFLVLGRTRHMHFDYRCNRFRLIVGGCQSLETGDSIVVERGGGQADLALELAVAGRSCEEFSSAVKTEMVVAG